MTRMQIVTAVEPATEERHSNQSPDDHHQKKEIEDMEDAHDTRQNGSNQPLNCLNILLQGTNHTHNSENFEVSDIHATGIDV